MKGIRFAIIVGAVVLLAGCGGDTTTTFVLSSGSPAVSASSSASSSAAPGTGAASPSGSSLAGTAPTPIPGTLRIIIDSPDGGSPISSPVQVSGTASVDNGTVVGVVLDAAGNELGRGTATASAAKPAYGHYDLTVSFSGATSGAKGKLKVFGVSPKDGTTPTYFYFINVTFA